MAHKSTTGYLQSKIMYAGAQKEEGNPLHKKSGKKCIDTDTDISEYTTCRLNSIHNSIVITDL